ncbi:MerR family transcriptional regulator [Euzebya sp.]|uniref:helix-turn-helix domain-containing protein n=1 Tax=Euzebya sp. TaxID=1971409 RepID=UPI003517CA44
MAGNRYHRDIPLPGLADGESGYRGPAVASIVGISYRQLDHWTSTGLVTPSVRNAEGSGSQRLYGFDDIVQLKVIKRLRDAGVSLQRIRTAIDEVRERGLSLRDIMLASDSAGKVIAVDDQQQAMDLLMSGQGVFFIAIDPVAEEVSREVATIEAERADPPVVTSMRRRRDAI